MRSYVMDRFGTKERHERETEEAERLVRRSPKVKPPRHDRRRERMEVEDDPDLDTYDKDLSMNYKVIGGSDRTAKDEELISVRLKGDPSKVVQVTQQTLRDEPSKYEQLEDEEADSEEPELAGEEADARAQKSLRDMVKADPEFGAVLKDFTNPKADMFQWAKSAPDTPVAKFLRGRTPPKGVKTLGDLQRALLHKAAPKPKGEQPEQSAAPAKGKPKEAPKPKEPQAEPAQESPAQEQPAQPQSAPKPEAEAPAEEPPAQEPAEEAPGDEPGDEPPAPPAGKKPGGSGKKPPRPSGQPTRPVTKEEAFAARAQIVNTFPTQIAAALVQLEPALHPDEIHALVSDYHTARAVPTPTDKIDSLRETVSKFYTTDPNQVPPPKTAKGKDGKSVPLESLSPEEQAQATRKHQVQTVAMSLAAQAAIAQSLKKNTGAPEDLAERLSGFMLSGRDEAPGDRQKRGAQQAEALFYEGLEADPAKPVSDETVKRVLEATKDPGAKQLAVGYFQAQDYQEARKRFLSPGSDDHISERQSPKEIASRLSKAAHMLRKLGERYPEGSALQDTALTFRSRVMRQIGTLAPDKQPLIQDLLDEEDNDYYDETLRRHKQARRAYEKVREKAEKRAAKDYEAYSAKLKESGDPDLEPPPSSQDHLAEWGVFEPTEPVKPPRYDLTRKKPHEREESAQSFWDDFTSRTASRRVLARWLDSPFSTYPDTSAMGRNRQAVYWGTEPYPKDLEPYAGWQQPQARDLGAPDFTRLLKAAREWLDVPVLSTNIEGIVRDTQLRAALDLAISTEGYGSTLHPTVYNNLLARLAGEPQGETLMTVTAFSEDAVKTAEKRSLSNTVRNPMPKDTVEFKNAQVDHFMAGLDRVASTIQTKFAEWGMTKEAARELVQSIDKLADEFESTAYGVESLTRRQAEIVTAATKKTAEVIQRDSDEKYMDTFKSPTKPIQTEADEPYMRAYADDDTSGVHHGKADNGKPLAP